jgi:thymidylate synthase
MASGDTVVSRGSEVKELTSVHMVIENPQERCIILRKRKDNIFHKIAESLWVMSGENDAVWLSHYLPRAMDYSDDGVTWRAAYGDRLRRHFNVDQIAECLRIIKNDTYTRRAVMSIFDPANDYVESKDIPCNNWLHFLVRENEYGMKKLNLHVAQINTFEWSILQMMMAKWLHVGVGTLTYSISSLHLYSQHYGRANDILRENNIRSNGIYDNISFATGFNTSFEDFNDLMDEFYMAEYDTRHSMKFKPTNDEFINECLTMLAIYNEYLREQKLTSAIIDAINSLPDDDFKFAAFEYFSRNNYDVMKKNIEFVDSSFGLCIDEYFGS